MVEESQQRDDPEVARLNQEIRHLQKRLHDNANPERSSTAMRMRNEINALKGEVKALHHELDNERKRNELLLATEEPPSVESWRKKVGSNGRATAIIVLSDWHVEEVIEADKVNHLNEFNLSIAEQRIERTFRKALYLLEFSRKIAKIDEVVVALLGDFITGYIHEELEESNELAPLVAIRWVQGKIISGLQFLRKNAKANIIVPTAYGNHGRTHKKKRVSTAAENSFEYNLYCQLEQNLSDDPRIRFKVERGYHNHLEVQKRIIRFHHGDAIKFGGGVGGITIPVNKAISQWNKSVWSDLDVFGHFHQFNCGGLRWQCNGSLIGYSPYAVAIKAEYEKPMQSFMLIDRNYGNCLAAPIFCEEADDEG